MAIGNGTKVLLGGLALGGGLFLFRALRKKPKQEYQPPSWTGVPGLEGEFAILGVSARPTGAITLPSGSFAQALVRFTGTVENKGNVPFDGQVAVIARSGGVDVDVKLQNVLLMPGASVPIVLTGTVPATAPPGNITAYASLFDNLTNTVLKSRESNVLGVVQPLVSVSFEGTFGVV